MQVDVLGTVEVRAGDTPIVIGRTSERALLVRLALAGAVAVADERLVADLWGDADLARPVERLRVLVSRLRSSLGGEAVRLTRTSAGYRLDATVTDLAGARTAADRLAAAARAGDHVAARSAALDALGRWRGPALADLRGLPFGAAEGARLDDWHRDITIAHLAAETGLGAGPEHVQALQALAAEHPLHEGVSVLYATALYQAGRQADALAHLAHLRRSLADELGIDPAPETADLELRLLRQDPTLRPAPPGAVAVRAPVPVPVVAPAGSVSAIIGRDSDLAALADMIGRAGIVTLVGEPGCGKSRLAAEVAARAAAGGRTVHVLELAAVRARPGVAEEADADTTLPAGAVRAALVRLLDLPDDPDAARDGAVAALTGALLVVDNAEHLVDQAADVVGDLRDLVPGLSVLVTSQRPLLVEREVQHRVRPLGPADAATLFRSRAASYADTTSAAAEEEIAVICAAVDGLPLGIELAAGLTRALTVRQIADRIDDRLRLLVGGRRDRAGRHSSLRSALDWSYELLDDQARQVLRRLAAFAGGFDLEAAEIVAAGGAVESGDVAPVLSELVDRSLVTVNVETGRPRFLLLESVRAHAAAHLAGSGEAAATGAALLDWAERWVATVAAVDDFASAESVSAVFAEWPNLAAALDLAAADPQLTAAGLRLANGLHTPWVVRAWFAEASQRFAAVVTARDAEPAEQVRGLSNHAFHALMSGRIDVAAAQLERAAALLPRIETSGADGDLGTVVRHHQGIVAIERGRLQEAVRTLTSALAAADGGTRRSSITDALGTALLFSGDPDGALTRFREAIALDEHAGDEHRLARGLSNEAKTLVELGCLDEAGALAERSDHYARRLDDRQILPLNDLVRAAVALQVGDLDAAEASCRAALAYTETGASMAHIDLAQVLVRAGRPEEARPLLDIVYLDAPVGGAPWLAARAVSAALELAAGDRDAAHAIAEQTAEDYATAGFGWPRYARELAAVRRALGAEPAGRGPQHH
ncbi:ATP-binding protein [Pseudonocardia sp. CA-107938]|uniref:ATP-binding protein n=1 Tax=Pseudonocardia sp. CA-107938 TaxID=3240021 RepID=UPI003D944096